MDFVERNADKLGTVGSLFAALYCIGTPAILAFLAAIGAGFIRNDRILLPLLVVSLLVALWGLEKGREIHRNPGPLWLGVAGAASIPAGMFFVGAWLVNVGGVLLITATVWNVVARHRCATACAVPEGATAEDQGAGRS